MTWSLPVGARGVWVKIPVVEVVEVLAGAGVDFIVIDREHGAIDLRDMTAMLAVAHGLGLPVLVRVPGHETHLVQPALDAGADGVLVPHVNDGATARAVVEACRFPPMGHRPASPTTRVGGWGLKNVSELVQHGNERLMVVAQVEDPRAVECVEEIVAVPGIDAVFVGPFDLALSSGFPAGSPDFDEMVARVEAASAGARILGGVAANAAAVEDMIAAGYGFVMVGADVALLATAARTASRVRAS